MASLRRRALWEQKGLFYKHRHRPENWPKIILVWWWVANPAWLWESWSAKEQIWKRDCVSCGLSGKETEYLCEDKISCFCLWATCNTGIPVRTVRKKEQEGFFPGILFRKWKLLPEINSENKHFSGFFLQISGIGSAGIEISKTRTRYPIQGKNTWFLFRSVCLIVGACAR